MSAHRTVETNDIVSKIANDNGGDSNNLFAHNLYADNSSFKAAQAPTDNHSTQVALGNLSITNDGAPAEAPKGFWARLDESIVAAGYAEAGMVPPDSTTAAPRTAEANAAQGPKLPNEMHESLAQGPKVSELPAKLAEPAAVSAAPTAPEHSAVTAPAADAKSHPQFQVNLGDLNAQPGPTNSNNESTVRLGPGSTADTPTTRIAPEAAGTHAAETPHTPDVQSHPAAPAAQGTHDSTQAALKSAHDNVGKHVTELEPGINPRLGCVRMLSHALHEADPTFPETNNTAQFRRLLKQHGYEEVTVKPGDPAIGHSNPGDIVIGSRPDGMPSHVAMSMGDGKVFNNNSDSGQGQLDSINQFNQGMHDSKGHWNSNGFTSVEMFRKVAKPEVTST